ncbi:MAG TPA: hypothetical protein VJP85_01690, partial [Candidatus Baltobacteraceae bacterium]|nr:hypothetical protein [Candidatus Baltobacteraceae bacterium]
MLSVLSFASVTVGVAAPPTFHRVANGSMNANTPPAVLDTFKTRDGRTVSVLERGFVVVQDSKKRTQTVRYAGGLIGNSRAPIAPSHQAVMRALSKPVSAQPYLPGTVVVVLNAGSALSKDDVRPYARALAEMHRSLAVSSRNSQTASAPAQTMVYPYSNDAALNRVLSRFAVADAHRLFASTAGTRVAAMRSRARSASSLLPVENAYLLTITNGTVRDAVVALRKLPSVAYASPNFRVATMTAPPVAIPAGRVQFAKTQSMRFRMQLPARRTMGASIRQSSIPGNYDVAYSGQSMLNASGVNAIAAYDEITSAFGQLPGAGEIITNVSIGDLDDPSAAANQADPCYNYLNDYNVPTTTEVIGGQRYLSLPSMPLIPTYTADTSGNTNPLGEVCGAGDDGEIDLDFSVMAPLPHNLQRPDAQGSGFSDLLGIAPGAQFRLVVPQNPNVGATDIAGALLGAALQQPAPNVITASLGWGAD